MFAKKPLGGKIRNGMRLGKDRNTGMESPLCLMPMRSQPTETFTGARNTKCLTYWEENGTNYFWKRDWGSVKRFRVVSQHLLVSFFPTSERDCNYCSFLLWMLMDKGNSGEQRWSFKLGESPSQSELVFGPKSENSAQAPRHYVHNREIPTMENGLSVHGQGYHLLTTFGWTL